MNINMVIYINVYRMIEKKEVFSRHAHLSLCVQNIFLAFASMHAFLIMMSHAHDPPSPC